MFLRNTKKIILFNILNLNEKDNNKIKMNKYIFTAIIKSKKI